MCVNLQIHEEQLYSLKTTTPNITYLPHVGNGDYFYPADM